MPLESRATAYTVLLNVPNWMAPTSPPPPALLHDVPSYSYAMVFTPLSPDTAASILPDARGTAAILEADIAGLPKLLAVSKVRVEEPAFVVLLAVA